MWYRALRKQLSRQLIRQHKELKLFLIGLVYAFAYKQWIDNNRTFHWPTRLYKKVQNFPKLKKLIEPIRHILMKKEKKLIKENRYSSASHCPWVNSCACHTCTRVVFQACE